ncbi:MAG: hypothetical protein HYY20_06310 [Candidatus Tectomicrobia bacterium]|uniref:YtkA-like domain-containing protein n=1 Tax=Tectimicrobiota bacterium TaxID=2528274 RepID=A0A932FWM0_UNCTE|nr:hypothetical protein [Candidatus Tectomicrobia bacterium]
MHFRMGIVWILLVAGGIVLSLRLADAHHGGLALEEEEETDTEATQWQQEVLVHGYRVKFLSYPRVPAVNEETRLVFEIQSADTGLYVSDLKTGLQIRGPGRMKGSLQVPAVAGVPGYYEGRYRFPQAGSYRITFKTQVEGKALVGEFTEKVGPTQTAVDPRYILVGNGAVALASAVTLVGAVLSLRRWMVGY